MTVTVYLFFWIVFLKQTGNYGIKGEYKVKITNTQRKLKLYLFCIISENN